MNGHQLADAQARLVAICALYYDEPKFLSTGGGAKMAFPAPDLGIGQGRAIPSPARNPASWMVRQAGFSFALAN